MPAGMVWAAVLLGVAAVIGAVAMLLWVVRTTQAPATATLTGQPTAIAAAPAGDGASASPVAAATGSPVGEAGAVPATTAAPGLIVEDWSGYADDEALRAAFTTNSAWTTNGITLTLLPGPASPMGPAGAAVAYTIQAPVPNDYVGFERDLVPPQDWRGYSRLATWVQTTDRSPRQLVLQFQEASGEVWRHRLPLESVPLDGAVSVPLTAAEWEWADWSVAGNQQLDLDQVNHFGVFIGHTGPGAGEVRLGTLAVQQGE
jgi:hypothetical protein